MLTARYEGASVGEVGTLLWCRRETPQPLPPPDEDALPFTGSGMLLTARRTSQRAASGVTQHRRWRTSSQTARQNTPRSRRRWMRTAEHTRRTAIPSASARPRERQPAATSPRGGARAATPTAACRACQTSKARQVRSRRDVHGFGQYPCKSRAILGNPQLLVDDRSTMCPIARGLEQVPVTYTISHSQLSMHRCSVRGAFNRSHACAGEVSSQGPATPASPQLQIHTGDLEAVRVGPPAPMLYTLLMGGV